MSRDWDYSGRSRPAPRPRTQLTPRTGHRVVIGGLSVVGAVALLASAAAAYWTADGTGTGTSAAATASPVTTAVVSIATGTLYPGATADLSLTIKNPNLFPVRITAVSGNGAITAAGGLGTCTTTGVTLTAQTGLTLNVPARAGAVDGSLTTSLTGAVAMSNASDNGCQAATFTIPVTLTALSAAP